QTPVVASTLTPVSYTGPAAQNSAPLSAPEDRPAHHQAARRPSRNSGNDYFYSPTWHPAYSPSGALKPPARHQGKTRTAWRIKHRGNFPAGFRGSPVPPQNPINAPYRG